MVRHPADFSSDPAIVIENPDDDVTPEHFTAWLDRHQDDEPVALSVHAVETLAVIRAAGEA
jgi:hypothetical protein